MRCLRLLSIACVTVVAAAALSACGSSSSASSSSGGGSGASAGGGSVSGAQLRARVNVAKCLRSHGIDVPDPPSSGPGLGIGRALRSVDQNSPKFKAANSACENLRSTGLSG